MLNTYYAYFDETGCIHSVHVFLEKFRHDETMKTFRPVLKTLNAGLVFALLIVLVISGNAFAASETDVKSRNICQIFTKHNPKLQAASAKKYADIAIDAGKKYKQDPYVIAAIIVHESTVNYKAVSKGGVYGLMQVRWKVHEKAIKQEYPKIRKAADFLDPKTNIFFGTRILSECAAKSDNLRSTLLRYSGGGEKVTQKVLNTVKQLYAMEKSSGKSGSNKPDTAANTPAKKTPAKKKRSLLDRILGRNK